MKAFDLRSWLTGFAMGLCNKPLPLNTGKKIVAYSYNGTVLPKLPEWDKERYPFAALHGTYSRIYISQEPFVYLAEYVSLPYYQKTADENGEWYWSELVERDNTIQYFGARWANHNIYKEDGTLYLAASEPTPIYLPMVMYDGEEDADYDKYADCGTSNVIAKVSLVAGAKYRITINGVSSEHIAEKVATSGQVQIGNAGLNGNDLEAEDDGGEWLLASQSTSTDLIYFYIRTPGTYQLKIERLT